MRQHSILGQLGTAFSLSAGYLALHVLGILLVSFVLQPFFDTPADQLPGTFVVSEGQLLRMPPWQLNRSYVFETTDGEPFQMREKQVYSSGAYLEPPANGGRGPLVSSRPPWNLIFFFVVQERAAAWYFVQEQVENESTAYFVAYSNRTRSPMTYIGANGATETVPAVDQRFKLIARPTLEYGVYRAYTDHGEPLAYVPQLTVLDTGSVMGSGVSDYVVLTTRRGVEHVHLQSRQVEQILADENLSSMAPLAYSEYERGSVRQKTTPNQYSMLVRDTDTILHYENTRLMARYQIPDVLRNQPFTAIPVDSNRIFYSTKMKSGKWDYFASAKVQECDAAGKILGVQSELNSRKNLMSSGLQSTLALAVLNPMPLQFLITLGMLADDAKIDPAGFIQDVWPSGVLLLMSGMLSVLGASRLRLSQRQTGHCMHWTWYVYVFLLGAPGLVGYLMHFRHRHHPTLEPAEKLGTEIFG